MEDFMGYQEQAEEIALDLPRNAQLLKDDYGVYKVILKPGVGKDKPAKGSLVTVHYQGRVVDPDKPNKPTPIFDSSLMKGEKFRFNVGRGEVVKGYDLAVMSMLKGEKCKMVCAPKYGYGARGKPPNIPQNAVMEYEIELFEWEGEDLSPEGNKSVVREMLVDGEDFIMPNMGAEVDIELLGKYKDKEFYNRKFKYNVGEADPEMDLVPAIDMAVQQMRRGERSRLLVKPKYGFGSQGSEKFKIPPNSDIEYELLLKNFEKAMESWEMTDDERIKESRVVKERGNGFMKESKVAKALIQYKKILDYLEYHDAKENGSEEERNILEESKKLKLAACLNLALCFNKVKQHKDAIDMCAEALKLDPQNEKGIYRAGEAYFHQREYENARDKFKEVMDLFPGNKPAQSNYEKCVQECRKKGTNEKNQFKGMFDKFSQQDEEEEIRKKVSQQKEKAKAKAVKKESRTDEPSEGTPT